MSGGGGLVKCTFVLFDMRSPLAGLRLKHRPAVDVTHDVITFGKKRDLY